MDERDLDRASEKLQKNFNELRRPVTMSQFLSNESLRIAPSRTEEKIYKCELERCQKQFSTIEEFEEHN